MSISRFIFLFSATGLVLFGPLDRIQKALEKADFEKVVELVNRGIEKEPQNPGFTYFKAKLLFTPSFDGYNPDSARLTINEASLQYELADAELIEELQEDGVSDSLLQKLSLEVRDFLYTEMLNDLSISGVTDFMGKYPGSVYESGLIFKRDSMVFRRVQRSDTKPGYLGFIKNYPNSVFRPAADSLLDQLRYLDLVNGGNLEDYRAFRSMYPRTNRLAEVEEFILKVSTASHHPEDLKKFLTSSGVAKWKKRAGDVLYYLDPENLDHHPLQDSAARARIESNIEVFPVMDHEKFGFHSRNGRLQVPYSYDDVSDLLKCTTSSDPWVFVQDEVGGRIILKNGKTLLNGVENYVELSNALALVDRNGFSFLYHKSGFRILEDPIASAEVLANGWIKVERNGKWGLFTLFGLPIAEVRYDDIYNLGLFWVFERDDQLAVYTSAKILREVESRGLDLEFKFDDLELVNDTLLIGFKGAQECLLDQELNFLIPWGPYEIHPDSEGWYVRSADGYNLYNNTDDRVVDSQYQYLESGKRWLALQSSNDWILIPRVGQLNPMRGYDSIKLIEPAALVFKGEEKTLLFSSGAEIELDGHELRSFSKHPDFLLIKKEGALGLYDGTGEAVFDGKYDDLAFVNDSLLKVTRKGQHGIIHKDGTFLLNPIFETLDVQGELIITLYDGMIGCYDLSTNVLIPPEFESRIEKIMLGYKVKKDGKYGLVDVKTDPLLDFKFEGIEEWNDTSLLVTNAGIQSIINLKEDTLMHQIEKLELLVEKDKERVFKFVQKGKFGLMSDQSGVLLKAEYSDIFNIGPKENPLFFADQHLSNAGFHVVSYVDDQGKLVFSKAYNKEEFDRILCEDY